MVFMRVLYSGQIGIWSFGFRRGWKTMEVLGAKTKTKLDPPMALELKVKQNMCFPLLLET